MQDSLPAGTTLNVSVDNALPIEAALREVLIAVAFALVVGARRHLRRSSATCARR